MERGGQHALDRASQLKIQIYAQQQFQLKRIHQSTDSASNVI